MPKRLHSVASVALVCCLFLPISSAYASPPDSSSPSGPAFPGSWLAWACDNLPLASDLLDPVTAIAVMIDPFLRPFGIGLANVYSPDPQIHTDVLIHVDEVQENAREWRDFWSTAQYSQAAPEHVPSQSSSRNSENNPIQPLIQVWGMHTKVKTPTVARITSTDEWKKLWMEHLTGSANPPWRDADQVEKIDLDFDNVMLIAIFDGPAWLCRGYRAHSTTEQSDCIVVRVKPQSYQSMTDCPPCKPWGVLVLPRSDKEIVLEEDVNTSIGAPPRWKLRAKFPSISKQSHLTPEHLEGGIGP